MARTISCEELAKLCADNKIEILDVRTPMEYHEVHITGAKNIPLDQLDPGDVMASRDENEGPLYVVCRSGSRGGKACTAFEAAGFTNVVNIEGGTMAWEKAGLPVVRSQRKVISLERQVRIAAGMLSFLGGAAAILLNDPRYAGLSAFVGAGLVFAGITDTCGMGLMLAKMPWNRVNGSSAEARTCTP